MTNKEAIEIIKKECYIYNPLNFDKSTRVNTALDKAINALNNDMIAREAYIKGYDYGVKDWFKKKIKESEDIKHESI